MKTKKAIPVHTGELERWADIMIQASQTERSLAEKKFILTEESYRNRMSKEVYVESGFPDASLFRGVFGRTHSFSDKRPTNRGRYSHRMDTWRQDAWESF